MSSLESLPGYDQWKTREPEVKTLTLPLQTCPYSLLARVLREALEGDPVRFQVRHGAGGPKWIDDRIRGILEDYFDIFDADLTPEEAEDWEKGKRADQADRKRDERNAR